MAATDIRVLIPAVRRAVEGVGRPQVLTEDELRDIVADAIARIILFSGAAFGKTLEVTETDAGLPVEYATSDALTLPEGSVIAAQAALDHLVWELTELKTSETIRDEGQEWSYQVSAGALVERIKELRATRDRALLAVADADPVTSEFVSYLAERDSYTAALVEPVYGSAAGSREGIW